MFFRELNRSKCKTYLVACESARKAALVDPIKERVDRYMSVLAYWGYRLELAIDTHTHADHRSGVWELRELTGARVVMHRRAPAPHVDLHVDDGDEIAVAELRFRVLYTPGHTPDSISLLIGDRVLTGDTLLIHGTGRADFAGGDAGAQYDSISGKLFALPDSTLVFPAHDYRGHTQSTIGDERRHNPRIARRSREAYVELMNNLRLGLPDNIQESLQANQSAVDDDSIQFPTLAQLDRVRQLTAEEVQAGTMRDLPPLLLDVREPDEFTGELGHIPGSRLIPLKELSSRAEELGEFKDREIIVICRAGVRSATAAAILTGLGFEHVSNLKGGMLDWNERGFPAER
jgi:sulfur dioxygenase